MPSELAAAETLSYSLLNTPVGWLTVIVSEKGLLAIRFEGEFAPVPPNAILREDPAATSACVQQLSEYFRCERRNFRLDLDLRGTDFQKSCWRELLNIPYGEVRSYADIARAIGRPTAFRAVGMANHSNPIPIVIPCHRVLASGGELCGYGGGLDVKQKLLELEGANWRSSQSSKNRHGQLRLL